MENVVERTLVLVKPDGVQRGLIGQIIDRFEKRGLKFLGLKLMKMTEALASKHYSVHQGKAFYDGLISYITSGPVVVMVLEGKDAISAVRMTMGDTNPSASPPGTIRGDLSMEIGRNLVHGSDSQESAHKEIALFFTQDEMVPWRRDSDKWINE
jgi:nucleoside-diphosphate kinase